MSGKRPGNKTARFAYNPDALAAYLDHKSRIRIDKRLITRAGRDLYVSFRRRYVNGRLWCHSRHGRVLYRWVTRRAEVSRLGAEHLLNAYGLDCRAFERWAKRRKLNPILRDHTTKEAKDG